MKKNSLLKVLGIIFLIYVITSFIIPVGHYESGVFTKESIASYGLFEIFLMPILTLNYFHPFGLIFLIIGAYYGVLNKTKAYPRFVENVTKKLKGKEKSTIIVTTIVFALLSSLTGLTYPLLALVPLFAAILMSLGYNKISSMFSTVGAILVGNMASTYGLFGYTKSLVSDANSNIALKLVLLVLSIVALIVFTLINTKDKDKENEIMLYSKTTKKVSTAPFVTFFIITFVVAIVGMINWELYGVKLFTDMYTVVMNFKIGTFPIFAKILGSISPLGYWAELEFMILLIVSGLIIAKIYKLSFKDIYEGAKDGMKEILPVALVAIIANIIYCLTYTVSDNYSMYASIHNRIMPNSFNSIGFGFSTAIGSVIYNNIAGFMTVISSAVTEYQKSFPLITMISQTIHGLVQLLVPTSVILAAGLTYFKISYVDYLKKVWKLLLTLLALIIIILIFI